MDLALAVFADFEATFLGGPSQLTTPLGPRSVLAHALGRAARIGGVSHRCLFVRARDESPARDALHQAGAANKFDLLTIDDGARPRRSLIRSARKWNLDAWRGSPLGTTWFDEYAEPINAARVLDHYECEGVLCLDGHQPLLDVAISDRMIAHQREHGDDASFVFTQAPPGLAGILLRRQIVGELVRADSPVGLLTAYRPEAPQMDLITKAMCCRIDSAIAQTPVRLTADTRHSRELLSEALTALGEDCDAEQLCGWLRELEHGRARDLPIEIELELTTDDPLPDTTVRPRGTRIPRRQIEDLDAIVRVAEALAAYDDRLLVLGGHGDPLAHPRFVEIIRAARHAGVCGLGVATPLVNLSDEQLAAFVDSGVDAVEVLIDAHSAETYRNVHRANHFAGVLENIDRIEKLRRERHSPQPLIVCSLTRCAATMAEIEPFFDTWIEAAGSAKIRGYSEYGGLLGPDPVLRLTPPVRAPCRRINSRLMLLADGQAIACDQDAAGRTPIGSWLECGLGNLWTGAELARLRTAHRDLELGAQPLCAACGEWFRP